MCSWVINLYTTIIVLNITCFSFTAEVHMKKYSQKIKIIWAGSKIADCCFHLGRQDLQQLMIKIK